MRFVDCNAYFGLPAKAGPSPALCPTAQDLVAALERAGIEQAVAWHVAQHDVSPRRGNELLAEALAVHPKLLGCWTVLPPQTGETAVAALLKGMKKSRIVALRAFPAAHRYLLNGETLGPLLEELAARRIPLLYSMKRLPAWQQPHTAWQELYDLLGDFPRLTLVVCDHGTWGCDRYFRPLLEKYRRVFIDTTLYFLDGGLEDLVARYGPSRILFGSGLPERYPGGMMLALRHAEISEAAKEAIAGGNLARLLKETKL